MIREVEETRKLKMRERDTERGREGERERERRRLQSILSERDRIVELLSRLSCQVRKCTATEQGGRGRERAREREREGEIEGER